MYLTQIQTTGQLPMYAAMHASMVMMEMYGLLLKVSNLLHITLTNHKKMDQQSQFPAMNMLVLCLLLKAIEKEAKNAVLESVTKSICSLELTKPVMESNSASSPEEVAAVPPLLKPNKLYLLVSGTKINSKVTVNIKILEHVRSK